jgi:hypothetical protein
VLVQIDAHERLTLPTAAPMPPPPPHQLGAGPRIEAGFQPCAGQDPDPGRERAHIHDGAARLCVKVYHTPPGAYLPGVALHQGERRHVAGARQWVHARRGCTGACDGEVEPRSVFPRLRHPSSVLPATLHRPGRKDVAAGGDAFDG